MKNPNYPPNCPLLPYALWKAQKLHLQKYESGQFGDKWGNLVNMGNLVIVPKSVLLGQFGGILEQFGESNCPIWLKTT
jgi:hypothetical protein